MIPYITPCPTFRAGSFPSTMVFKTVKAAFSNIYHKPSQMVVMPSGYYYFGGYDMKTKEITVLMVEPGKHPKVTTLNYGISV